MLKRILLVMLAVISLASGSTVVSADDFGSTGHSRLYETPDLVIEESFIDTPGLEERVRARDIVNGEDMTLVKKNALPFLLGLMCVWALVVYAHLIKNHRAESK